MKSHSILTVGSVLTKDAEEYGIYQGNPAVLVKKEKLNHNSTLMTLIRLIFRRSV